MLSWLETILNRAFVAVRRPRRFDGRAVAAVYRLPPRTVDVQRAVLREVAARGPARRSGPDEPRWLVVVSRRTDLTPAEAERYVRGSHPEVDVGSVLVWQSAVLDDHTLIVLDRDQLVPPDPWLLPLDAAFSMALCYLA